MGYQVSKTDAQWREELNAFEYQVLRLAATERPYTGELLDEARAGSYHCRGCDAFLFESDTKFDSHCGWPSFYKSKPESIEYVEDRAHGMVRTEVRCAACGSHLGHIFDDAPQTPTGMRYCINSVSLSFHPN
jgi:peptide-methionine (R)-S-oxide reductase